VIEMLNRIALLLVFVLFVVAVPGDAGADVSTDDDLDMELEGTLIGIEVVYIGASLLLTTYNSTRLEADDPSKGGGAVGLVVGSFTALSGVALFLYPHPATLVAGAAGFAVGLYTAYVGLKSLGAVRRKYIEAEEQGLTVEPILIDDGAGRLGPGVQVSWKF
jgi:hypothetical protein